MFSSQKLKIKILICPINYSFLYYMSYIYFIYHKLTLTITLQNLVAIKSWKVRRKILILRRKYGKLHYISY